MQLKTQAVSSGMVELISLLPSSLVAFSVTSLLIELTPGPNMGYLAVVAIRQGRAAGFAAVAGVALGLTIIGTAAALGVATLIVSSDNIYNGLRIAGVLFLLYLAWEGWQGGEKAEKGAAGMKAQFLRGLINNLLNPKAALFYIAVLPNFVDVAKPIVPQTLILTAAYVMVATTIHSVIIVAASSIRPFLDDKKRERTARRVLSLALAAFAIWFALTSGR